MSAEGAKDSAESFALTGLDLQTTLTLRSERVNELLTLRFGRIPLLLRRGGCGFNKKPRSHRSRRRRGGRSQAMVQNAFRNMVCERPPRPLHLLRLRAIALALRAKVASHHFLDVASTPPHEEGNAPTPNSLVIRSHVLTRRAKLWRRSAAQ